MSDQPFSVGSLQRESALEAPFAEPIDGVCEDERGENVDAVVAVPEEQEHYHAHQRG